MISKTPGLRIISVVAVLLMIAVTPTRAQEDVDPRPVTSIYSLEVGSARDLSTYLSPLYYSGYDLALSGSWTKAFNHWSDRCRMRFEAALDFRNTKNPVKYATMYGGTARFNWGLAWSKDFLSDFSFTLGPMLDIYGGALYLPKNGNNPVTAIASVGLDASASLSYRFKIGTFRAVAADEIRIPTLSAFFTPGYGESYYEIYLGNRNDLVHCGWWGNAMGVDNLLSLKINFGKTGILVGYRLDWRTFCANNLQTQLLRNAFVIGIIPNGF